MAISNIYNTLGWTNFYQSSKLLKAGLDGETADMYIPQEDNTPRIVETSLKEHHAYYPCWSLGRLIWLIPENYRISYDHRRPAGLERQCHRVQRLRLEGH